MDYKALQTTANTLITNAGLKIKIVRDGTTVASGYGVFAGASTKTSTDGESSVLAQTVIQNRTLLISGALKAPMIGDYITSDALTLFVTDVDLVRPGGTTVLYKVEVQ